MGGVEGCIKMITPEKAVLAFLDECSIAVDNVITKHMALIGELCVRRIKDRTAEESWIDRTGNLRSSIGYSVIRDGNEIIKGGFSGKGGEGVAKGKKYIESVISFYHENYALIIVAGMEYASYVEAIESKDVLASTELWAKDQWNKSITGLKQRINTEIKKVERKYGLS